MQVDNRGLRVLLWHVVLVILTCCIVGCNERVTDAVEVVKAPAMPSCHDSDDTDELVWETVASGLEIPWAFDFAPDGRIFITERPGRIRVVHNGKLQETSWAELGVAAEFEAGLMGIAVAPDFAETGHVYVVGTFVKTSYTGLSKLLERAYRRVFGFFSKAVGSRLENRVIRLTDRNNRGVEPYLVIDDLRAEQLHAGAALAFGPDGKLYVTVGEALDPPAAQKRYELAGKILRYEPDGRIPADNPFPNSPVYALGFRNVQGIDWHPLTQDLFAVEHGPSGLPQEGLRVDHDELNVIVPAGNYGWPMVIGMGRGGGFAWPLTQWSPAIAPGGMAVVDAESSPWFGNIFVGGLRGRQLRRVVVQPKEQTSHGWRVVCEKPLLENVFGRIRAVRAHADGSIYFTTSNRDGRGDPAPNDDRVIRVRQLHP